MCCCKCHDNPYLAGFKAAQDLNKALKPTLEAIESMKRATDDQGQRMRLQHFMWLLQSGADAPTETPK